MYAIIDTSTRFRHRHFVESAKFTELGWKAKLTRMPDKAKKYKTYQRAYNSARSMGWQYEVVQI